jgi:UDPglucose--hexose-1-phosphate uridylyltransferase
MSEFRQDIVSHDWVIIAPGRAKRPDELIKKRALRQRTPKEGCPFEDLAATGNPILQSWPEGEVKWKIAVTPNKYPALSVGEVCSVPFEQGIYQAATGVGGHELVITHDHNKNFADLDPAVATKVFEMFQDRFKVMGNDPCLKYISAFANWGPGAGASLWHPHYQLIALPVIPPHVERSLQGSESYFKKHDRCARCDVITYELKEKVRVVAENGSAIAIAPYASKRPFEVSVLPKKHFVFFEQTPVEVIRDVAALTQKILQQMRKKLQDPDFNFFVHSAPVNGKSYRHHHWHIEIVPVNVVSPQGGFEISTVININVIDPTEVVKILKSH